MVYKCYSIFIDNHRAHNPTSQASWLSKSRFDCHYSAKSTSECSWVHVTPHVRPCSSHPHPPRPFSGTRCHSKKYKGCLTPSRPRFDNHL